MTARKATTRKRVTKKKALAGWRKNLPQIRFGILTLAVAILATISLGTQVWVYHNTQVPQVIRDIVIVLVAHIGAGDNIPIVDVDYSGGEAQNTDMAWGLETNSLWLTRQTMMIIPLLAYENIGGGDYPDAVVFVPYTAARSFHVAGSMECESDSIYGPRGCIIIINERYMLDQGWNDLRGLLTTLTHELIHAQGGRFLDDPDVTDWETKSAHLESKTSAATIEALAAMCNQKNEVACRAFWAEIESMARITLRYRLRELPWMYDAFANIFLRDGKEERLARKNARFWSQHEDELYDIMLKYAVDPYENIFLVGLNDNRPLNTGVAVWIEFDNAGKPISGQYLNMPFDDAKDLLGILVEWIDIMTP